MATPTKSDTKRWWQSSESSSSSSYDQPLDFSTKKNNSGEINRTNAGKPNIISSTVVNANKPNANATAIGLTTTPIRPSPHVAELNTNTSPTNIVNGNGNSNNYKTPRPFKAYSALHRDSLAATAGSTATTAGAPLDPFAGLGLGATAAAAAAYYNGVNSHFHLSPTSPFVGYPMESPSSLFRLAQLDPGFSPSAVAALNVIGAGDSSSYAEFRRRVLMAAAVNHHPSSPLIAANFSQPIFSPTAIGNASGADELQSNVSPKQLNGNGVVIQDSSSGSTGASAAVNNVNNNNNSNNSESSLDLLNRSADSHSPLSPTNSGYSENGEGGSSMSGVGGSNNGGSKRKSGRMLPDELKDEAYWERRRKNNEAAKRSRDARRAKEDEIAIRAAYLEQENLKLRVEVAALKNETAKLRCMLYNS